MKEIVERRRECNKMFDLGGGRMKLVAATGPVHYKEDYSDPNEQWKDIDLHWEGNEISHCPYILTHDGKTLQVTNRKTKAVHVLELLEDDELVWERSRAKAVARTEYGSIAVIAAPYSVRFRKTILRKGAPLQTRFRIEGDMKKVHCLAVDGTGDLPIEHTVKDGILTETVKAKRNLSYPVKLDPVIDTFPVAASTDDVIFMPYHSHYSRTREEIGVGHYNWATSEPLKVGHFGSAMRFTNIDIEPNSIIHSAHLQLRASKSIATAGCRSYIRVETDADDALQYSSPPTYPVSLADFLVRWNNRTAGIAWDNIEAWSKGLDYDSEDFTVLIQGQVELTGWVANSDISIFWDDLDNRSDIFGRRFAYSFDAVTT